MSTAADSEHSGNSSAPEVSERIREVDISDSHVSFHLQDGRVITAPLAWSWRLREASAEERQNYEISPSGYGVHWPEIDEDLSARGLLRGTPARRPSKDPGFPGVEDSASPWSPEQLKRLREKLGMTQSDFGSRMGVRQATVSDWETGKQSPSPMARRLLDRIASSDRQVVGEDESGGDG